MKFKKKKVFLNKWFILGDVGEGFFFQVPFYFLQQGDKTAKLT